MWQYQYRTYSEFTCSTLHNMVCLIRSLTHSIIRRITCSNHEHLSQVVEAQLYTDHKAAPVVDVNGVAACDVTLGCTC